MRILRVPYRPHDILNDILSLVNVPVLHVHNSCTMPRHENIHCAMSFIILSDWTDKTSTLMTLDFHHNSPLNQIRKQYTMHD